MIKNSFQMIAFYFLILQSCSTGKTNQTGIERARKNCQKIDSLFKERYEWKSGNFYSNKIIPILEKESGIECSCNKGTYGYIYNNDSLFNADIEKWKKYFNCN
jgi:hypothetical protein